MTSILRLSGVCVLAIAARTAHAQAPTVVEPPDSSAVTSFSIKSGKIVLSSLKNPGKDYLPDGTYTNEGGTIIVILDGKIVRLQRGDPAEITEIASVRLNPRHGIQLTPNTNALMAVSEITLPTGTYTSEDGASSMRVVSGTPRMFTIPTPESH
jgi:hypothetical protein